MLPNRKLILLPIALLAMACARGADDTRKVDDALNSDLSLAGQARPYQPLDSMTAAERGLAPAAGYANSPAAPAPVVHRTTVVQHTAPRRSSGGGYSSGGSGGTYSAPARQSRIVKNTKRDAAIGAGAGAVIGAVTSKNKVKGGLIGAAAGGLLGAVIGNNVDKKRVP